MSALKITQDVLHKSENILVSNEKLPGVSPAPHWPARRLYIITGSSLQRVLTNGEALHLYVSAVVTSGWQLNPPERDWTL